MTLRTLTASLGGRLRGGTALVEPRAGMRGAAATDYAPPSAADRLPLLLMTALAAVSCAATLILVALGAAPGWSAAALLGVMSLAPGVALLPLIGARAETWGLGAVLGVSFGVTLLVAEAMLEADAWHPRPAAVVLAALCLPLTAYTFVAGPGGGAAGLRVSGLRLAGNRHLGVHLAVLGVAAALWIVAVRSTDLPAMAGLGLLDALPPTFYAATVLLVGGFAHAASRRRPDRRVLALHVVALATLLHGTTSLLYDVPRYPWTYKHIGITELLASRGSIDRSIDIYNNWPGFFALGAWVSSATGVSVEALADWAPLFFALAGLAALLFALRAITDDPVLTWTTAWLFVLTNWIGQNYYAPQSIAFVVALVVIGFVLRYPDDTAAPRWQPARLIRLGRRANLLLAGGTTTKGGVPPTLTRPGALLMAGGCYAGLVVTHQLSPVILLIQLGVLALICRRPPVWFLGILVGIEALWVGLASPFIDSRFQLFDFSASPSPQTGLPTGDGLPGVALVDLSEPVMVIGILALAVAGALLARRRSELQPVVPALALTPVLVLAIQQYGGEGPLRVYLFALPWLCLLAAQLLVILGRSMSPLRRFGVLTGTGAVLCTLFLLAHFGPEQKHYLTSDDVEIATWFEREAPAGAVVTVMVPGYPIYPTARYPEFVDNGEVGRSLVELPGFRYHRLGAPDVRLLERLFDNDGSPAVRYVVLSGLQDRIATLYRVFPDGSFASMRRALSADPDFRLVYRSGDGYVFEYHPRPAMRPRVEGYFGPDLDRLFDQLRPGAR